MNPGQKSPKQVSLDLDYEVMHNNDSPGTYYPPSEEIIVKHKGSNTFWRAVYSMRDDDSDYDCVARWRQVFPKQVTITRYEVTP